MNGETKSSVTPPPPVIDAARVICYAGTEVGVKFTDRLCLLVDGVRVGRVPRLVICENLCDPGDFLLLFCSENWESVGAIGSESVELAKERAEVGYSGISSVWEYSRASSEEVDGFVRREYGVDPKTKWWEIPGFTCEDEV